MKVLKGKQPRKDREMKNKPRDHQEKIAAGYHEKYGFHWVAKQGTYAGKKRTWYNIYDENGRHKGSMRVGNNNLCVHDGPSYLTLRDCLPDRQNEHEIYVWDTKENVNAALKKFRTLKLQADAQMRLLRKGD